MTLFRDGQCEPLKQWPEWAQIIGFAVCTLFINLAIGLAIAPLGFHGASPTKERMIDQHGILYAFLFLVIAGPFLETIIGQWLPLFVGRLAKRPPSMRIIGCMLVFHSAYHGRICYVLHTSVWDGYSPVVSSSTG
jgi:hypothetical protein